MENIIIALILIGIVGGILWYLIRAKKKGNKCIGCPNCNACKNAKSGGCSTDK